jgi:hypothetical protein
MLWIPMLKSRVRTLTTFNASKSPRVKHGPYALYDEIGASNGLQYRKVAGGIPTTDNVCGDVYLSTIEMLFTTF